MIPKLDLITQLDELLKYMEQKKDIAKSGK